eukprot:Rhum_TRINITY_DN14420_c15_g1::Rhum_TRINITY_DN14420_c15_g1_i1::g.89532::m.89532
MRLRSFWVSGCLVGCCLSSSRVRGGCGGEVGGGMGVWSLFGLYLMLPSFCSCARLVDLDLAVDLADKPEASDEANCARDDEEDVRDHGHVPEEQEHRSKACHLQRRGEEVEDRVQEDVDARRTRREERPPPPVVVLRAQLEVAHHDRDLGARDAQNDEDQEQEAKHVVVAVHPDRRQDEEQFDEDRSERQHTAAHDREPRLKVPSLGRNEPRDEVDACRRLQRLLPVSEDGSQENLGNRDEAPNGEDSHHRVERHSAGALLVPHKQVDEEEHREHNARHVRGGLERRPPRVLVPHLHETR